MSNPQWERVQEIFERALDLDGDARERYVREACEGDAGLLAEVTSLIEADEHGNSFLDGPGLAGVFVREDDLPEGAVVGPYRVVRPVGEGGMGKVYLAERADGQFEQRVALKVIKRGMDSDHILARFHAERQILARLHHPNIARLLDGGATEDGRPWFAMEYVEGSPIDRHCDEHRLDVDRRLELFATVCGAVQYAHAKLVVHRDLKPDNILVTADGTVKLLDFGIGKVLEGDDEGAHITRVGSRVLTPAYAAPEQLEGGAVGTAADVYSLGIVLFELLVGQRPERRPGQAVDDGAPGRADEPDSLLTALRRSRSGGATVDANTLSTTRDTRIDKLERKLRGDLEVICRRALQEQPERRFASVEALSGDVRRHLDGLPVLARPDSLTYRARKFVSRNLAAVLATLAMLSVVVTLVTFYTLRLDAARQRAEVEAERATDVAAFMVNLFRRASPQSTKRLVTARQLLDEAVAAIDTLAEDEPRLYSDLLMSTGMVYREFGDYAAAEPQLRKLVATNRRLFDGPDVLSIQAKSQLATTLQEEGKLDEAVPFFESALMEARALPEPNEFALAYTLNNLAKVELDLGNYALAEKPLREAAGVYEASDYARAQGWWGTALRNLGRAVRHQGRYAEADSLLSLSVTDSRKAFPSGSPTFAEDLYEAAAVRLDLDDPAGAEPLALEAIEVLRGEFPDGHPTIGRSLVQLATIHRRLGAFTRASDEVTKADSILRDLLPTPHAWIGEAGMERAAVLDAEVRVNQAEDAYRAALEMLVGALGTRHPQVALAQVTYAGALAEHGACAQAMEFLPRAVDTLVERLGKEHPRTVGARSLLSGCEGASSTP